MSISLVLLGHLAGTRHFFPAAAIGRFGDIGNLGVRIFFVISGFLITHLALREHARTGAISLKAFYIRRFLRIFPAFYIFILTTGVLALAGLVQLDRRDLLHAVTYTMNYHVTEHFSVMHLWSLSVEEQFYLIWPVTLALLGLPRAAWMLAATLVIVPIVRVQMFEWFPASEDAIRTSFQTVCDALATGCLLAIVLPAVGDAPWWQRVVRSRWLIVLPLAIVMVNLQSDHPKARWLLGIPFMNIGIALLIARYVQYPELPTGRVLNSPVLAAVGVASYSLYLWQELFLTQFRPPQSVIQTFPINLMVAVAAAAISYTMIERPFLNLKRIFQPDRERTGAPDAEPAFDGTAGSYS